MVLGVIQRGGQIGALVRLRDGSFIQANGDFHQPLNASQVNAALRTAQVHGSRQQASAPQPAPVPVVIIKRTRRW